jgi:hypothetical protein
MPEEDIKLLEKILKFYQYTIDMFDDEIYESAEDFHNMVTSLSVLLDYDFDLFPY